MTRVLVVDDHPIILQGCRRLLKSLGLTDVTEASGIAPGYRRALRFQPEVVVTDLTFAGDDLAGLSLIERLSARMPTTRILVFSMHNDPAIVSRALSGGALGYVLKDAPSGEFARAVTAVRAGKPYLTHELAVRVALLRSRTRRGAQGLTEREGEILRLIGEGYGYDRIAVRLGISAKTVINATSIIRDKLKVTSLADLIRRAKRHAVGDDLSALDFS